MKPKSDSVELRPDAWKRFERAIDVVTKSPPQPKKRPVKIMKKKSRKKRRGPE